VNDDSDSELRPAAWDFLRFTPKTAASREDCEQIWQALVDHRSSIIGTALHGDCAYLILGGRPTVCAPPPLSARNRQLLERVLLGVERKVLCFELGISPSTVAQVLKQGLADMGLTCSPARVPPLLAVLLHAARSATSVPLSLAHFEHDGRSLLALSGELESDAWRALAPAVRAVLRERLVGKSHADIASARHTSPRTVANQMACATHRLGVSGRFDLLRFMVNAR